MRTERNYCSLSYAHSYKIMKSAAQSLRVSNFAQGYWILGRSAPSANKPICRFFVWCNKTTLLSKLAGLTLD